ncbi:hypothetical protein N431DRAFT_534458 [Stipitochalara longipes BDJ]|nr:hypothetical protein N431DRAFT_534458 [Stipitochalara longipes BDJ]
MQSIYRLADLTIVAADRKDANAVMEDTKFSVTCKEKAAEPSLLAYREDEACPLGFGINTHRYLIPEYTKRKLSFPKDILSAFTGIMNGLGVFTDTGQDRLAGLPCKSMAEALLWLPIEQAEFRRRSPYTGPAMVIETAQEVFSS